MAHHNSGVKRDIPIKLGDFSVIDSEFSNIRERFDAEMRKMEDEMTKFRSELMNRESNFFKTSTKSVFNLFSQYNWIYFYSNRKLSKKERKSIQHFSFSVSTYIFDLFNH